MKMSPNPAQNNKAKVLTKMLLCCLASLEKDVAVAEELFEPVLVAVAVLDALDASA